MNKRVFSLAVLTMLSAFVLIMVIVYATNADKINHLLGRGKEKTTAVQETVQEEKSEEETVYGDQIGDNLHGFLLDDDFFDETEKIPSVVVIKQSGSMGNKDGTEGELKQDDAMESGTDVEGSSDIPTRTGMAVVGELTNPNPQLPAGYQDDATGASGYITTPPETPSGGFGQYIPADQTISGTPVGTP